MREILVTPVLSEPNFNLKSHAVSHLEHFGALNQSPNKVIDWPKPARLLPLN